MRLPALSPNNPFGILVGNLCWIASGCSPLPLQLHPTLVCFLQLARCILFVAFLFEALFCIWAIILATWFRWWLYAFFDAVFFLFGLVLRFGFYKRLVVDSRYQNWRANSFFHLPFLPNGTKVWEPGCSSLAQLLSTLIEVPNTSTTSSAKQSTQFLAGKST